MIITANAAAILAGLKFITVISAREVSRAQQEITMQIVPRRPIDLSSAFLTSTSIDCEKKYVMPPESRQSAAKETVPLSEKPSASRTASPVEAQQRAAANGAMSFAWRASLKWVTVKVISATPATHAIYRTPDVPENVSR